MTEPGRVQPPVAPINPPRCSVCGVVGGMAMNACGHNGIRLIGCLMLVADDYCDKPAEWRPANIQVAKYEWFCRDHAVQIAREEGMYGVYNRNNRDVVEEITND